MEVLIYDIYRAFMKIRIAYYKIVNFFLAKVHFVKVGKHCKFDGRTIWRKLPGSKIIIGDKCIFNSSHASNRIGVYTPCMFSTLSTEGVIEVGRNCGFSGTVVAGAVHVKLGNNVRCGANTLITDSDWHCDDYRAGVNAGVVIDDNVWLGYGVKVLKGVHIGENSLIGAGSIVTKDVPANVVAAGNPCKVIKIIG
ncbi:transferase hexapeptide (six repeat-containing protein) [Bacteroides luti]|uniref:Acetyltransferase n=2 Tax=Bacteroides luti TaxID=1297750 RepID=A0A1M4W8A8_9BACE|nr:transferase hexapeptide (six repeat-containing protein) [Bacteroides luti]